jgi:hypothetical protein
VDDLVQAMGLAGISKSTVSKLCRDIDDQVNAFLDRPLTGEWPYLWLDATGCPPRLGRRCCPHAITAPHRRQLVLDGFRSGWMAAMAALGQIRKSPAPSTGSRR